MIVRFVDIDGIVDNHNNFLLIKGFKISNFKSSYPSVHNRVYVGAFYFCIYRLVLGNTLISFWPLFKSLPRVVGPYRLQSLPTPKR